MALNLRTLLGPGIDIGEEAAALAVSGLTADSRMAKPGDVFFALPGGRADGASFITDAVARGAVAVVAEPKVARTAVAVPLVHHANPRQRLALAAARFHGLQPDICVAVTGTNGKTSVAAFVRQIWSSMGFRAASLGTVGVVGPDGNRVLSHTTPDPVALHAILSELKSGDHVTHLALEASSHGLVQHRLDGVQLAAGAFTNVTRDHLDYHTSFAEYFDAKMRLFRDLLPAGSAAVINADSDQAADVVAVARSHGLAVFTVGVKGDNLRLVGQRREGFGQQLRIEGHSVCHAVYLPLAGDFQASNALVAAGLVIATGGQESLVMHALESLKGAVGRLDLVATTPAGAPVFVDYAHTPDALRTVLTTLRPYARERLAVVFGCGGDRDRGKRPQMGAIANELSDLAYVTDDNPRSENPGSIRAEILLACPKGIEIGDRAEAIRTSVGELQAGDVLVVAGKGHETGQTIGGETRPFNDHDVIREAIGKVRARG
jgi:UDP-N-acetylmuramoyl-L-alanyl-D-glutamate--2,6-diaminopimelate ligase